MLDKATVFRPGDVPEILDGIRWSGDDEIKGILDAQAKKLNGLVKDTREKIAAAQKDANLSLQGRNDMVTNFKRNFDAVVAKEAEHPRRAFRQILNHRESALGEEMGKAFHAASEVTNWEIRSHLAGLNAPERLRAIQKASEEGDAVTLGAIRGAPSIYDLVSPHTMKEMEDKFARSKYPSLWQSVEDCRLAVRCYEGNITAAARALDRPEGSL